MRVQVHDGNFCCAGVINRAYVFIVEVAAVQCAIPGGSRVCGVAAVYSDESERKLLDLNLRLRHQIFTLANAVLVLKNRRLVIGGTSDFFSMLINAAIKSAPQLELGNVLLIKHEDVEDLVEDVNDIPEFWFGDGTGRPYQSSDRRNIWCYERCLSDENKITQKDLFNPGPWPYEEIDYKALRLTNSNQRSPNAFGTIEEDGEEDE